MTASRRQRGITLLISLIMLTVLTLFASAMIRLSSTNMLIAGNMAVQHALRDEVQQAIETDLSSSSFYNDVANQTGCWAGGATSAVMGSSNCFAGFNSNGYTITLSRPVCLTYQTAAGNSGLMGSGNNAGGSSQDTYWEVTASGTDTLTGTSVSLTQGVKITLAAGNCSNP